MAAVLEHRLEHQPVRQVGDRGVAHIGIVGEDHVPLFDLAVVDLQEGADKRAELAHDHLALDVGDHREAVPLFANTRGHGGAEQYRIHFLPGVAQGVLDDIDGNAFHINRVQGLVIGLQYLCWHCCSPPYAEGSMSRLPTESTRAL